MQVSAQRPGAVGGCGIQGRGCGGGPPPVVGRGGCRVHRWCRRCCLGPRGLCCCEVVALRPLFAPDLEACGDVTDGTAPVSRVFRVVSIVSGPPGRCSHASRVSQVRRLVVGPAGLRALPGGRRFLMAPRGLLGAARQRTPWAVERVSPSCLGWCPAASGLTPLPGSLAGVADVVHQPTNQPVSGKK